MEQPRSHARGGKRHALLNLSHKMTRLCSDRIASRFRLSLPDKHQRDFAQSLNASLFLASSILLHLQAP
jgi:hypothetical protein